MGFTNQERINLNSKVLQAGVIDAAEGAAWFESRFTNQFVVDPASVWLQLSQIPVAANIATAQANAAANPTIIADWSQGDQPYGGTAIFGGAGVGTAVRLTEVPGTNGSTFVAYTTFGDTSSPILDNWILPQLVPQANSQASIGYSIQLYDGDPNAGGTLVSTTAGQTGSGATRSVGWVFNNKIGMLLVAEDTRSIITNPYIIGFRYVGETVLDLVSGATGVQGPTGLQGPTGPIGFQGPTGPQGNTGDLLTGPQGPQGITGPEGTGPQGATGNMGITGPQGAAGPTGDQGNTGFQGPQGNTGAPGGPTGAQGAQGTTGPQGLTGSQGETGPEGETGLLGDTGPQGQTGPQGTQGDTGAQGTTGTQGPTGSDGITGPQGTQGETGIQGPTGTQGNLGQTGAQGATGPLASLSRIQDADGDTYLDMDISGGDSDVIQMAVGDNSANFTPGPILDASAALGITFRTRPSTVTSIPDITVQGGSSTVSNSGSINLLGGDGNRGGSISALAGDADGLFASGGSVTIRGGDASGNLGSGGTIQATAGSGSGTDGPGGDIRLQAGGAVGAGDPGDVLITAGSTPGTEDGGTIFYQAGFSTGGGSNGVHAFQTLNNGNTTLSLRSSSLDNFSLTTPALTGDLSFTLPAADGTANSALITDGAGTLSFGTPSVAQIIDTDGDTSITVEQPIGVDTDIIVGTANSNEVFRVISPGTGNRFGLNAVLSGFNTFTPEVGFHMRSNVSTTIPDMQIDRVVSLSTPRAGITLRRARGSISSLSTVVANDIIGDLTFQGRGALAYTDAARIRVITPDGNVASTVSGDIALETTESQGVLTERMRVNSLGQVLIGTTTASADENLNVVGDIRLSADSGNASVIIMEDADGSANANIKAPDVVSDSYTLSLPPALGSPGDVMILGPSGLLDFTGIAGSTGPQGEAGQTGPQGSTGLQGDTGAASTITGPQGPQGQTGPEGTGPQGATGNMGITGPQGMAGPTGDQGNTGFQGPQGNTGAPGGPTGAQGPQGVTGPQGLTGGQGGTGIIGVTGPQGVTGGVNFDLQTAYNNSSTGDASIVLNNVQGTLFIRDVVSGATGPIFEIQSNTGGSTYLSVDSDGVTIPGKLTVGGLIDPPGLVLDEQGSNPFIPSTQLTGTGSISVGNLTGTLTSTVSALTGTVTVGQTPLTGTVTSGVTSLSGTVTIGVTPLTGTVSVPAGTPNVTGVGTLFTTELIVGDFIDIAGEIIQVGNITNDTTLTLSQNHVAGAAGVSYSLREDSVNVVGTGTAFDTELAPGNTVEISGQFRVVDAIADATNMTLTVAASSVLNSTFTLRTPSAAVTGTGTLFTTELSPGDSIRFNEETVVIDSIADNTNLTLTAPHNNTALNATATRIGVSNSVIGDGTLFTTEADAGDFIEINGTIIEIASITNNTLLTLVSDHPSISSGLAANLHDSEITGAGTLFTTELGVGDFIRLNNQFLQVETINNNTSLIVSSAPSTSFTGSATFHDDELVGVGTLFTTQLSVGEFITINGETHEIATINNNTSLTLVTPHIVGASNDPIFLSGTQGIIWIDNGTSTPGLLTFTDSAGIDHVLNPTGPQPESFIEDGNQDTSVTTEQPDGVNTDQIVFTTAGNEAMRINGAGNLGIGLDSSIEAGVHIAADNSNRARVITQMSDDSAENTPSLEMRKSRGSIGTPSAALDGDVLGIIRSAAYDGSAFSQGPNITASATENWSASARGSSLDIRTPSNGSTTSNSRIFIDGDGNVGINNNSNPDNFNINALNNVSTSGTVTISAGTGAVSGTGTAFTTELSTGQVISIEGEVFTIASIADATNMTVTPLASSGHLNQPLIADGRPLVVSASDNAERFIVDDNGNCIIPGALSLGSTGPVPTDVLLDLNSTNAVLRLPRLTTAERDALTPLAGMEIFNTNETSIEFYDGVEWQRSAVVATNILDLYVDNTLGSDTPGQGFGPGASAAATIGFALALIPNILENNVIVNIAASATVYEETIEFGNRVVAGGFSVRLQGTANEELSLTAPTAFTLGSPSTFATVTVAAAGWAVNQFQDMFFWSQAEDQHWIIESNTADTLTLIGPLGEDPVNFEIIDHTGTHTQLDVTNGSGDSTSFTLTGQKDFRISRCHMLAGLRVLSNSSVELDGTQVELTRALAETDGDVFLENSEMTALGALVEINASTPNVGGSGIQTIRIQNGSGFEAASLLLRDTGYTGPGSLGLVVNGGSAGRLNGSAIVDGFNRGVQTTSGSQFFANGSASIIRNNTTGLVAFNGADLQNVLSQFTGNTTDVNWDQSYFRGAQLSVTNGTSDGSQNVLTLQDSDVADIFTVDSDGNTTIAGELTVNGNPIMQSIIFGALDNEPTAANAAALSTRNTHPLLAFDNAVNEFAQFSSYLPLNYQGSGLNVTLIWASTASLGDIVWSVAFERENAGSFDLDNDSFAAAVTGTGTAPGAQGVLVYTTIAFSNAQIDGLLAGEAFRIQVERLATNGGDTNAGDGQLVKIIIEEQ